MAIPDAAPVTPSAPAVTPVRPAEVRLPAGVAWEDPPPVRGKRCVLTTEIEQALRGCPGKWLRFPPYASKSGAATAAKAMKTGKWPGVVPAEWEAEARVNGAGSILYVRFVGKEKAGR